MSKVYINFLDYYLPQNIEKNTSILNKSRKKSSEIKEMISKIGIISRRVSSANQFSTDLALFSARKVLKKIDKNKIDFLIYCTNTPDYLLPSNSCIIHEKLNLKSSCGAFDIILACSGYVYSLSVAKSLIQSKLAKNIILITSDTYTKFIPIKDAKNRILFGDGSSSSILSEKKSKGSYEIKASTYGTDGSGANFAIIKNFGNRNRNSNKLEDKNLFIDGPGLYNFALNVVPRGVQEFMNKHKIKDDKINYYIFHQANKFMIDGLVKIMKLNKKKVIIDMSKTGNTTSSSIPIIIKKCNKKFKRKENILLVGFGGGLSWGITLIQKQ